jgi:hypothetical protein
MSIRSKLPRVGLVDVSTPSLISEIKNNAILNFAFVIAGILLLAPALGPVPSSNENVYLLDLARVWNPSLLSNDWTWAPPLYSHRVFSFLFGMPTLIFSLETVGWIGRILSWTLITIALFRLGRQLKMPLWMNSLAIFLWLLYQQALVGGEFILGTFEAKSIAYIFLFFGLSLLIEERDFWGSLCLGLCFTFHAVIGMWALLATGLSVLCLRYSIPRLVKMAAAVLLAVIPGLIVIWPTISGNWTLSLQQAKYLALVAAPFHMDPLSFPKRDVLLLAILFAFNWFYFGSVPDKKPAKLLNYFQLFLGVFALIGVAARVTEHYRFLFYFPFRLFPVFVPLFFFMNVLALCQDRILMHSKNGLLALAMVGLLAFPSALNQLIDQTKLHYRMWATFYDWDDMQKCFIWVSEHTPLTATVILPPWRKESFYLTKRATVAHWPSPRIDRFEEWQDRIKLLMGEFSFNDEDLSKKWDQHYNQLDEATIDQLKRSYGGDYLISKGSYQYPIVWDSGTYRVYSLSSARSDSGSIPSKPSS